MAENRIQNRAVVNSKFCLSFDGIKFSILLGSQKFQLWFLHGFYLSIKSDSKLAWDSLCKRSLDLLLIAKSTAQLNTFSQSMRTGLGYDNLFFHLAEWNVP